MWWLAEIIGAVVLLFHAAGLLHAVHALMRARTSQGAIAWIMALLFLPYVAVPLYWFFGRDRFEGYVRARRSNDQALTRTEAGA